MRTIPSRRILFVISLILCCTVCAQEEKEFNVDSELYSYFQRCQENVGDSKVLHMADTLYWMSEKRRSAHASCSIDSEIRPLLF